MTAIAEIHKCTAECFPATQATRLLQAALQSMSVIRIAVETLRTQSEAFTARGHERGLVPEFVLLVRLAFAYAFDLRSMQAVQLVLVISFLVEKTPGKLEKLLKRFPQWAIAGSLPVDVANGPPQPGLETRESPLQLTSLPSYGHAGRLS